MKTDVQKTALRPILTSLAVLTALVIVGTAGYRLIEGMTILDALFMTVITLSTVGFEEVKHLSPEGQIFTMGLIVGGAGLVAFTLSTIANFMLSGEWRAHFEYKRRVRMLSKLTDHVIICGYGRVGRYVSRELMAEGVPFVIIDKDAEKIDMIREEGFLVIKGNAASEALLYEAGIERAKGVVVAASTDAENVFIVLTVRSIRPNVLIVSRANFEESESKLLKAGASRVLLPYRIAGRRMVTMLVRPDIDDFLDEVADVSGVELLLEKVNVAADSELVGKTLGEVQLHERTGVTVLALKTPNGELSRILDSAALLRPNMQLIALGTREQLQMLIRMAHG